MIDVDEREAMRKLRAAVYTGDGHGLVDRLSDSWPANSLQLIGDGLLAAIDTWTDGAPELAERCVRDLRGRGWDGDLELAAALEGALGVGPRPELRRIAVDHDDLAEILEGDPVHGGGRIDLTTGEVWPQAALDNGDGQDGDDEEDDDEADRWLWVESEGSRAGYHDMEWFIEHLDDEAFAERLARSIVGRGAFRRFRDQLHERQDLVTRWQSFSDDRHRGRARQWLMIKGFTPVSRSRPAPS